MIEPHPQERPCVKDTDASVSIEALVPLDEHNRRLQASTHPPTGPILSRRAGTTWS